MADKATAPNTSCASVKDRLIYWLASWRTWQQTSAIVELEYIISSLDEGKPKEEKFAYIVREKNGEIRISFAPYAGHTFGRIRYEDMP